MYWTLRRIIIIVHYLTWTHQSNEIVAPNDFSVIDHLLCGVAKIQSSASKKEKEEEQIEHIQYLCTMRRWSVNGKHTKSIRGVAHMQIESFSQRTYTFCCSHSITQPAVYDVIRASRVSYIYCSLDARLLLGTLHGPSRSGSMILNIFFLFYFES